MKKKYKEGEKATLTVRREGRSDENEPRFTTERVQIIKIYPHHIMVRRKAGFRECFTHWEFLMVTNGKIYVEGKYVDAKN